MDSNSQPAGNGPPPKPWDRAGGSSGPAPFKPPSGGTTSDVVEASGTAKPGEIVSNSDRNGAMNRNALGRAVPTRPWEQNYGNSNYAGGYGSTSNNNSGYGSGMYGSSIGGYGSGMYGNSMYNRGGSGGLYGSGMYGGGMHSGGYGSSMMGGYGSSMMGGYGSSMMGGYGSSMGGYGMGMGGPYGAEDPNNPYGPPPSPPSFWISALHVMQGVVNFFGRISILIDQNTQAFHMFMTALLQLFDRSGMLYGELARFVLKLLGIRTKSSQAPRLGPDGLPIPGFHKPPMNQNLIQGPKAAPDGSWDNVWVADSNKQ